MAHPFCMTKLFRGNPRLLMQVLPVAAVIAKLLRRRDAHRYQSAREAWDDLRQIPRF